MAGSLFAKRRDIYYASKVPRIVNILCHKALLSAYGSGELKVTQKIMRSAISDTKIIARSSNTFLVKLIAGFGILLGLGLLVWHYKGII